MLRIGEEGAVRSDEEGPRRRVQRDHGAWHLGPRKNPRSSAADRTAPWRRARVRSPPPTSLPRAAAPIRPTGTTRSEVGASTRICSRNSSKVASFRGVTTWTTWTRVPRASIRSIASIARRQLPGTPRDASWSSAEAPSSETCTRAPVSARRSATSASRNQPFVVSVTITPGGGEPLDRLERELPPQQGLSAGEHRLDHPEVDRLADDSPPLLVVHLRRPGKGSARRVRVAEPAPQVAVIGQLELRPDRPLGHLERADVVKHPAAEPVQPVAAADPRRGALDQTRPGPRRRRDEPHERTAGLSRRRLDQGGGVVVVPLCCPAAVTAG